MITTRLRGRASDFVTSKAEIMIREMERDRSFKVFPILFPIRAKGARRPLPFLFDLNQKFVKFFTKSLRSPFRALGFCDIFRMPRDPNRMRKSALLLSAIALSSALQCAIAVDVTGKVTLQGTPPPEKPIAFTDQCSALNPPVSTTRHYVVGKDNGLANVFVYISKGLEGKKFTPPAETVEINQVGCNYDPYILGCMVGQTVRIKNSDPIMHNIHSLPAVEGNTEFNFAEMAAGDVNDSKWTASITKQEVLVKMKCDVHQWMFCFVGVVDHPFFAVTDKDGHFKIANVPPGSYTLTAYHLKTHQKTPGVTQEIKVEGGPVTADFTVALKAP